MIDGITTVAGLHTVDGSQGHVDGTKILLLRSDAHGLPRGAFTAEQIGSTIPWVRAHLWLPQAEVTGGPAEYSARLGGHAHMVAQHLNRKLSQEQRRRWVGLLLGVADEIGVPDDPEFRSAFVSYLEWGSRLAVINSQPSVVVDTTASMPTWGWGEVKGPYKPEPRSGLKARPGLRRAGLA